MSSRQLLLSAAGVAAALTLSAVAYAGGGLSASAIRDDLGIASKTSPASELPGDAEDLSTTPTP